MEAYFLEETVELTNRLLDRFYRLHRPDTGVDSRAAAPVRAVRSRTRY